MMHESLKVNEIVVKEDKAFRLKIRSWEVTSPKGLHNLDFVQECLNKDGEVDFTSTYNFYLTKEEIAKLSEGLKSL
jgi:hypothetical protein